jgi:hypothetical protein
VQAYDNSRKVGSRPEASTAFLRPSNWSEVVDIDNRGVRRDQIASVTFAAIMLESSSSDCMAASALCCNKLSARLVSFDQKRTELRPGTVLVREWDRRSQRVMVMPDGFAWNGQTYDSLSKVAFAITGTKWNGPRFFGLRDKEDRLEAGVRS